MSKICYSEKSEYCRLCANVVNSSMPIFDQEGLEYNIASKINLYLPIDVTDNDILPLYVCYPCVSTLNAWHGLFESSKEAESRLRNIFSITCDEKPTEHHFNNDHSDDTTPKVVHYSSSSKVENSTVIINKPNHIEEQIECIEINDPNDTLFICEEDYNEKTTSEVEVLITMNDDKDRFQAFLNERKLVKENIKNVYACAYCETIYRSRSSITTHVHKAHSAEFVLASTFHPGIYDHECIDCYKVFNSAKDKTRHMIKVHGTNDVIFEYNDWLREIETYKYICTDCPRRFTTLKYMSLHYKRKHENNPKQLPKCSLCQKSFCNKTAVRKHQRTVHKIDVPSAKVVDQFVNNIVWKDDKKYLKCEYCDYMTQKRQRLREHRRSKHLDGDSFICNECGREFKLRQMLVQHLKRRHTETMNSFHTYKCDLCDWKSALKSAYTIHLRNHNGERPYCCEVCGKSFIRQSSLYLHKFKHERGKHFFCEICRIKFTYKQTYINHQKAHANDRQYKCEVCNKAFVDSKALRRHGLIHSNERSFICQVCGGAFKIARYLKQHERIHLKTYNYRK